MENMNDELNETVERAENERKEKTTDLQNKWKQKWFQKKERRNEISIEKQNGEPR